MNDTTIKVPSRLAEAGLYALPEKAQFRLENTQKIAALLADLCGNSRDMNGEPMPVENEHLSAVLDIVSTELKLVLAECDWVPPTWPAPA